jgi:adenylosuccinate lyase
VVDTALCATLTRAGDLLLSASDDLVGALKARALEFADTPVAGPTFTSQPAAQLVSPDWPPDQWD